MSHALISAKLKVFWHLKAYWYSNTEMLYNPPLLIVLPVVPIPQSTLKKQKQIKF